METDEIDKFFSAYPAFAYNRHNSSPKEFYRMCDQFNWQKNKDDSQPSVREEAWQKFRIAMVVTFNSVFGTDANDASAWERICVYLGIDPLPEGMENQRQRVTETHVNLADMLDGKRVGETVEIFATKEALQEYTIKEGRYFPKEEAYAGGLLKYLLREIHNQYHGKRGKRKTGKRSRSQRK